MNTPYPMIKGVRLSGVAAERLRTLEPERRERVAHVLEEMVAVLEVSNRWAVLDDSLLQFTAASVKVIYSIEGETSLLVVHEIIELPAIQQAG